MPRKRRRPGLSPSRKTVPKLLLAILFLIALGGIYGWLRHRRLPEPIAARLLVQSGTVEIMRADAGMDAPLSAGGETMVQQGNRLRTDAEGQAMIVFGDEGTILLKGETQADLLELYRTPLWRGLVVTVALDQGEITVDLDDMTLRGAAFQLETRTVTVQGTSFTCHVKDTEHVQVQAHSYGATVTQGSQEALLEPGQIVEARLGDSLIPQGIPAPIATFPDPTLTNGEPVRPTLSDLEKTLFPSYTPTLPVDGTLYTVKSGDTLYSIAQAHDLSWETLWEANQDRLDAPETIHAGQTLRIPTR